MAEKQLDDDQYVSPNDSRNQYAASKLEPSFEKIAQDAPPAPQLQQMEEKAPPPPPYAEAVSRFKWLRKYKNQRNVQCCLECSCRTGFIPCCLLTGIYGCFSTVVHGMCNCLGWVICCKSAGCEPCPKSACPKDTKCDWAPYRCLDSGLDHWPVCCLGTLKFEEERSIEEKQEIADCNECCCDCITCPVRFCTDCCTAFCDSKCVKWCKKCCTSGCATCSNCCCGCIGCARLLVRRLLCIRPEPARQDMQ